MKLAEKILNICRKLFKEEMEDSSVWYVTFVDGSTQRLFIAPGLRGEEATNAIEKNAGNKVRKMNLQGEYKNGVFIKAIGGELKQ